jgi:Zn-dependent peptidase ImmA (M78 family)
MEKFINIPYISNVRIEKIIAKLETYDVYTNSKLDAEKICKFLESKYPVSFDFHNELPEGVLGKIEFDPLRIRITKNLETDPSRWRYTLAHEIGHLIVHSQTLSERVSAKTDTELSLSYKYNVSEMTARRLEFQANLFASSLLLPIGTLTSKVKEYFMEERIHKGKLYWDHQPVNQKLVMVLLTRLSLLYQVSVEVARIRLVTLGLLEDGRYKSLRDILKEMKLM